jgi:hypothetical protein
VTIWICHWWMNTLVTSQCQPRLSRITKISSRRISQSDWNIQIKLNYIIRNIWNCWTGYTCITWFGSLYAFKRFIKSKQTQTRLYCITCSTHVTIWICHWWMNTLVTSQCQPRLSRITKISPRRMSQSDWNIQIKLNYFEITWLRLFLHEPNKNCNQSLQSNDWKAFGSIVNYTCKDATQINASSSSSSCIEQESLPTVSSSVWKMPWCLLRKKLPILQNIQTYLIVHWFTDCFCQLEPSSGGGIVYSTGKAGMKGPLSIPQVRR